MSIHLLNCFTCNARWPSTMKTGAVSLLVETSNGLTLVDTGLGRQDYIRRPGIVRLFQVLTEIPLDPSESAIVQVQKLGYELEDVKHIVLTHMHFDHCGGLPDFPQARVHVHRREYEAFTDGRLHQWSELAYVRRHIAHNPHWVLYEDTGEKWYDFNAIHLPGFDPQIWLIPLFGHTRGHCGVAIETTTGWLFHAGDAGAVYNNQTPAWLIKMVLGPHDPCLREFMKKHPEVRVTTSHMFPEFFRNPGIPF
jgi:glyoxylase-like metal-dependent hydrolase (beta-lactamase superfamily II)